MNKEKEISKLRNDIKFCTKCVSNTDNSLVHVINNNQYAPEGVGYWSDAFPNYNAKLMIVGQDWGSDEYLDSFIKKSGGKLPKPYREDGNDTWENLMDCLKEAGFETKDDVYGFKDIYLTNRSCLFKKRKDFRE